MVKTIAAIEVYQNHNGSVCVMNNIIDRSISASLKEIIIQTGMDLNAVLIDETMKKAPEGTAIPSTGARPINQNQNIIKRSECQP